MKASTVKIYTLRTLEQCNTAIEHINNDPINIVGGMNQWMSDQPSTLIQGAIRKIARIERRIKRLFSKEEQPAINHTVPDLKNWRKKLTKKELTHLSKEA